MQIFIFKKQVTYSEVIDYYEKYYSPNNANFFSYGDLDFTKHLEYIDGVLMRGKQHKEIKHEFKKPDLI